MKHTEVSAEEAVAQAAASLAIEEMYFDKPFLDKVVETLKRGQSLDDLRREIIAYYDKR